jgi:hypothetical protein
VYEIQVFHLKCSTVAVPFVCSGWTTNYEFYLVHLWQQCHNSKFVIFQEKLLKFLKCYNFLWVQRRHNCSPAESFANCVMTLYLLKVHMQMFLSKPVTQKCQILNCDTLDTNERYMLWKVWVECPSNKIYNSLTTHSAVQLQSTGPLDLLWFNGPET